MTRPWFYTRPVLPHVWLVAEPQHVCCWLVEGEDMSLLIDSGMGILPIRPVAAGLTAKPLVLVNTHYHFDHVGGNHEFEDIAIHELGAPQVLEVVPRAVLDAYLLGYAERQLEAAKLYRDLDREFFWLLGPEADPRPLPDEYDASAWTIQPSHATRTVADGDVIDLGGRVLTVLHTPGHSPDSICLLDERLGILFTGDTFNAGPNYAHFPDSDLRELTASARRLAGIEDQVRLIACGHYGRLVAETGLLHAFADALELVQEGEVQLTSSRDILNGATLEASFDHFWITLPDPAAPRISLTADGSTSGHHED